MPKKKVVETSGLPWRRATFFRGTSSAVLDADGNLVCGSSICQATPKDIANHELIVKAVNAYGWSKARMAAND